MNWWQAIVLGIVEGITEYLPVSSTGHLLLAQRMLGIGKSNAADAFAICIQGGAIIAVLGIFRGRFEQACRGLLGKVGLGARDDAGFRLVTNLAIAFLPAMVLGVLLNDVIESRLMGLAPVVAAWLIGGLVILAIDAWLYRGRGPKAWAGNSLDAMSWQAALGIGLLQTIAMCPGTSRSLATIIGGLLVGLSLVSAVEFSFLLGVITLLAATAFKATKSGGEMLTQYNAWTMLAGGIAACLSAVIAVRWMLAYLSRHRMAVFGYYRIGLAMVVAVSLYFGWLSE